ncbi:MAG TPA: T9SS type A sorting domain-containing protein [Bacteroidia bacterium]|nr:T9SS type A sorting domain-containing protein [Bacteroidia bacterium]
MKKIKMKTFLIFFVCLLTISISVSPTSLLAQIIAPGGQHSLAICNNDSSVMAWGRNTEGQLGNGNNASSNVPVSVSSLTSIIAIADGRDHSIALRNNGTVWTWGRNIFGQLGNGTTINSNIPVQVTGLTGIIAIASGSGHHSIALKNDSTVWNWGYNFSGQLGNGTFTNSSVPVQVTSLSGIVAIGAGYWHNLALKNDGTVWAWGGNQFGQLGDGTTTGGPNWGKSTPVQVSAPSGITALAGGAGHSMALRNDGTVWMWGDNTVGQYGNGTCNEDHVPVQVTAFTNITAIASGGDHNMVLKNDSTVWACGANGFGQLGNGTNSFSLVPVQVSTLTGIVAIAGGEVHSMALKSDGTIRDWGSNVDGELGNGNNTSSNIPVQVQATFCVPTSLPVVVNNANNDLVISPNPATDFIYMFFSDENSNREADIVNVLGETVIRSKNQDKIDISHLSNGIYFLRAKTGESLTIQKFIKQ